MKKLIRMIATRSLGLYFNLVSFVAPKTMARKAFLLFCTPQKGKVSKAQHGFLEDAKDLILEKDGMSIQTYRWKGKGPIILLLHGWESNTFRWRNTISRLQKEDYDIIAMDAPGHGNSSGHLLNLPLYSSCVQKVINTYEPKYVIGHSLGGMALLHNLYEYKVDSQKVERVVTLGSPSELSDFMKQYKKILGLSSRMIRLMENYFEENFKAKFSDFSSPKFAKNIKQKGLLIHDKLDLIAPYWSSKQVHASWKNSTLLTTKGLGHSLHQEKVREQIVTFLKS